MKISLHLWLCLLVVFVMQINCYKTGDPVKKIFNSLEVYKNILVGEINTHDKYVMPPMKPIHYCLYYFEEEIDNGTTPNKHVIDMTKDNRNIVLDANLDNTKSLKLVCLAEKTVDFKCDDIINKSGIECHRFNKTDDLCEELTRHSNTVNEQNKQQNELLLEMILNQISEKVILKKMIKEVHTAIDHLSHNQNESIQELKTHLSTMNNSLNVVGLNIISKTGCTMVGKKCVTVHITPHLTWSKGNEYCNEKGGHRAEFPDINFDFNKLRKTFPEIEKAGTYVYFMLNVQDEIEEGIWKWGRSGTLLPRNHPRWLSGYPRTNRNYNCLLLRYDTNGKIYIHDHPCTNSFGIICEYDY